MPGGRWAVVGAGVVLVILWGFNAFYTIDPQEVGVELQFGRPKPELSDPGLHFHLWPVETVERVNVTENQTGIGSANTARGAGSDEGLMLSGDQNIVDVRFSVLWAVSDPVEYLFNVREPEDMVRAAGESAMRQVVGSRPAQDIFRNDRAGIAEEVRGIIQAILDSYKLGVRVSQVAIENVAPPAEVADAFDEVQRAEQDEDRFQEEARQYANTLLGDARGQAAKLREDAAAYRTRVVEEAKGEAARFISVYTEYAKAPEITRERLYLETMEQVLGDANKVLLDDKAGGNVLPYLPLPGVTPGVQTVKPLVNGQSTGSN
jgi:membrane protease subunit HflK